MKTFTKKLAAVALAAPLGAFWPAVAGAQASSQDTSQSTQDQNQGVVIEDQNTGQTTQDQNTGQTTGGQPANIPSGQAVEGNPGKTENVRPTRPGLSTSGGTRGAETSVPSTGYVSPPIGQRGTGEVYWPPAGEQTNQSAPTTGSSSVQTEQGTGSSSGDTGQTGTGGGS